jgi:hypothetical protein
MALVAVLGRASAMDAEAQKRKQFADLQLNATGNKCSHSICR